MAEQLRAARKPIQMPSMAAMKPQPAPPPPPGQSPSDAHTAAEEAVKAALKKKGTGATLLSGKGKLGPNLFTAGKVATFTAVLLLTSCKTLVQSECPFLRAAGWQAVELSRSPKPPQSLE